MSSIAAMRTNWPEVFLEAVPLGAVTAPVEVRLRLGALALGEVPVQVGLEDFLTPRARIEGGAHSPPTVASARCRFRMRRPRCSLDMTVPTGMSRICAASW